ncbi:MAG: hypothetical protein GX796_11935 [Clostridiaceae bacterium]|jgi:hypothetical protein|nr:hypothetical protein [Clostridiaceae bacterium]
MNLRVSKKHITIITMAIVALTVAVYTIVNRQDRTINIEDGTIPLGAEFIPAKDAGMVAGDKSAAPKNANQLIKALNRYGTIIIDDSYYISTPTEPLTTNMVEIIGAENGELIFDNPANTRLFNPVQLESFILKNVKVTNLSQEEELLIVYGKEKVESKVDVVNIEGCTFTGNISLYRHFGNPLLDPNSVDFGINEFIFTNNEVYNTKLSFILLIDIPVNYCEISNNTIQNFMYTFLNLAINNDNHFVDDLRKHIKYLKVENNNVFCEDTWWGNTSSGSYYSFINYEGTEVLYNNNHVEGMKALSNIALYDAYLSAGIVNYTNNTWKNNICFASDKLNNTLLKSKGGGGSLVRNYSNNTFIVEEDYAERIGQPKDNLFVYFISLTRHADSYTIRNNIIDVYDLRLPASSLMISNLFISENTIKARKSSGNLAIVRLNDEYPVNTIEIKGNLIEIGENYTSPFNLLKMVDNRVERTSNVKNVTISNNQVEAPISYLFYTVLADDLVFSDNKIIDVSDKFSNFAYKGSFNLSESSGNSIMPEDAFGFDDGRRVFGMNTQNGEVYE